MKTIQGKEFNYEDILLYSVNKNKEQIFVLVNDPEQLNRWRITKATKDAPMTVVPYSEESERLIFENMKLISSYEELSNGDILVEYFDTNVVLDSSNKELVKRVFDKQQDVLRARADKTTSEMSEEEKTKRKSETDQKSKRSLAAILAALVIAASGFAHYYMGKNTAPEEKMADEGVTRQDTRKIEQVEEVPESPYLEAGKALHTETELKKSFVLKYQQVAEIKWDENLSTEVIEVLNGNYPTSMKYMSAENANAEMREVLSALELLVSGNLNSETNVEDIIDLSSYIENERDAVFVNNAMVVARSAINEAVGQPTYGKILAEDAYTEVNKFSKKYTNAVDQLLRYEYTTVTDPSFLELNPGCRFLICSIFNQANAAVVPTWTHITIKPNDIYYRAFKDDATGVVYYPKARKNGTVDYVASNGEKYTENEIFAMSGNPLVLDDRNYTESVNPNLHQIGIQPTVDAAYEEAMEEVFALKHTYVK